MKKFLSSVICMMALVLAGCGSNATCNKVVTGAIKDVTTSSVVLYGEVNVDISAYNNVQFGMMISDVKDDLNNRDGEMYEAKVLVDKEFKLELKNLSPDTEYYYCAWVYLNNTQYEYGDIKKFITGNPFSVSSSKQVYFSPGNLQYHPANNKWQFAAKQTDYKSAAANSNISSTYNGWIDLFGWSTSATNFGVSTSLYDDAYYGSFVDWGINQIGNAAPNTWRTLTSGEWFYLLYHRTNAFDLRGVAEVDGVNGLILLPDNWTCPAGVTFKSGFINDIRNFAYYHSKHSYSTNQSFTAKQWSKLAAAGAIFLPAAGCRQGSIVSGVRGYGYYWSATEGNGGDAPGRYADEHAIFFNFQASEGEIRSHSRHCGRSVRLVKDVQ